MRQEISPFLFRDVIGFYLPFDDHTLQICFSDVRYHLNLPDRRHPARRVNSVNDKDVGNVNGPLYVICTAMKQINRFTDSPSSFDPLMLMIKRSGGIGNSKNGERNAQAQEEECAAKNEGRP